MLRLVGMIQDDHTCSSGSNHEGRVVEHTVGSGFLNSSWRKFQSLFLQTAQASRMKALGSVSFGDGLQRPQVPFDLEVFIFFTLDFRDF